MKKHIFRLHRGADLLLSIRSYAAEHEIGAAVIACCVGCLSQASLRDASGTNVHTLQQRFEIVSATGTVSAARTHLHISLAGEDLKVIGGHLRPGCIVNTTAEVALIEFTDAAFSAAFDPETGYDELVIAAVSEA